MSTSNPMTPGSKRLRLEPGDGSPITEYSIENEKVQVRTVELDRRPDPAGESSWQELTPEQLRFHVERHTVVAEWLKRRLGWRRLLRECVRDSEGVQKAA